MAFEELRQLTQLTRLELRRCGLVRLPASITALCQLRDLSVDEPMVGGLERLGSLTTLTRLRLVSVVPPDEINVFVVGAEEHLLALPNLRHLDIADYAGLSLPPGAWRSSLTNLTVCLLQLLAADNQLAAEGEQQGVQGLQQGPPQPALDGLAALCHLTVHVPQDEWVIEQRPVHSWQARLLRDLQDGPVSLQSLTLRPANLSWDGEPGQALAELRRARPELRVTCE